MKKVFIIGAKRTAIGTFAGSFKSTSAVQLGVVAVKSALAQANIEPADVCETIMGNILSAGIGMGPGRQVSIYSGIPIEKPGYSVNMICGSGMKATMIGATDICADEAQVVVSGGIENMNMAPYMLLNGRNGYRLGHGEIFDHAVFDGLTDVFNHYHMGITAENLAEKYGISREEQDKFAVKSQEKALKAIEIGRFKDEIAPVVLKDKKGEIVIDTDEHPRKGTSLDTLAKLKPSFKKDGTITAGNASGINDGASATILASEDTVTRKRLSPLAEFVSWAQYGVDPSIMGIGPVGAISKALKKAGLSLKDIDLIELNEAFAAQSLAVLADLKKEHGVSDDWLEERVNVNGGAIALGHPIGASGNRIIVTLLYEMKKRGSKLGLASLCIGGGMGTAVIIKNV
jgi:acetyl-CoA C-acetyltransferase